MKLILIGASAGSIDQLLDIFAKVDLKNATILTALHMPYTYLVRLPMITRCSIAKERQNLQPDSIYLCDSRYNRIDLRLSNGLCYLHYEITDSIYRPDIDSLFVSASKSKSAKTMMGILLSGIGENGAKGLLALKNAGAYTIVSDEQSSSVYGMPKAAVNCEGASEVLDIAKIIERIERFSDG